MKKLKFIMLSLIALNLNTLCVVEKKAQLRPVQKHQVAKRDIAKIAAASFGCAFFTMASLMAYDAKKNIDNKKNLSLQHIPTYIVSLPNVVIVHYILGWGIKDPIAINLNLGLTALQSAILTYYCGKYVHQKLLSLKAHKKQENKA